MTTYTSIKAILANIEKPDQILALNPELAQKPAKEPKTEARKDLEREIQQNFARQFEATWQRCGGPALIKEFKFCETRNWKNDYLHVATRTIIELDGGIYSGGRHVRPQGFIEDCVKLNMATMLDYRLIRIPTGMATDNYLSEIITSLKKLESRQLQGA